MPIYNGFSTQDAYKPMSLGIPRGVTEDMGRLVPTTLTRTKKFKLTDENLVIQDFINALNIPQGSKPGKPQYGTAIWSYIFEPNTIGLQNQIEFEIRRVAEQDPRLIINTVTVAGKDNGINAEIELAISPMNNAQILSVYFDRGSGTASIA